MSNDEMAVVLVAWDQMNHELIAAVQRLGGYSQVVMACLDNPSFSLESAVGELVASGIKTIALLGTWPHVQNADLCATLVQSKTELEALYPTAELVLVLPQLDIEEHAQMLVQHLEDAVQKDSDTGSVPLSVLAPHQYGDVFALRGGHEFVSRLAALGFIPGAPIKVVQNFGVGPLIVRIRDTRIALGREEAHKVRVRPERGHRRGKHGRQRWHRKGNNFE